MTNEDYIKILTPFLLQLQFLISRGLQKMFMAETGINIG